MKNADRGGVKQLLSTGGKHRKYQPLGSLQNYLLELSFALYVVFPLTPFLTLLALCTRTCLVQLKQPEPARNQKENNNGKTKTVRLFCLHRFIINIQYIGFILAFASSIHNNKQTFSLYPEQRSVVYARRVDTSALVFSLSSHRHSFIGLVFRSDFIDS